MKHPKLTISVVEAAKRLGVGRNQAYQAVHAGQIPSIKIGRRLLVPLAALDKYLDKPSDGRCARTKAA